MTPHVVYRFFGRDGSLLYIGCSKNLRQRIATNHVYMHWWADAFAYTVETYPDRETGRAAERAAIRAEQPRHNKLLVGAA